VYYDYLIVGAGIYGSTMAHQLASAGKKVLVIDKRNHIAGNVFTEKIGDINVHKYGAHIFHTNNKRIWDYVQRFADFNRFTNSPIANYKGEIFSLPFNMYTFNKMWGISTPQEALSIIEEQKKAAKTDSPSNLEEQAISLVGIDIYNKLIKGYTEKQWGRSCKQLPPFIIQRLPVRLTYDNNYFNALYQGIPIGGYTNMVDCMLKGIDVCLGVNYLEKKKEMEDIAEKTIYSGPIDEFYNYSFGVLEYRSLRFQNEVLNISNYQGNAVVNYTDSETPWTRIIEHKWFEFGLDRNGKAVENTIITKEFSCEWRPGDEPYYPINDKRNNQLYNEYYKLSQKENNIFFGGRLGEYKYYDMDQVINKALSDAEKLLMNS